MTIKSSLDGYSVLPRSIRWTVTSSLPPEQVRGVRFVVDSDRWWGDRGPPYSYGGEGAYLPTTWIATRARPGALHNFEVRVFATNGESYRETVRVRLPQPKLGRNSPGAFRGYFGFYGFARMPADVANVRPPKFADYRAHMFFYNASLFVSSLVQSNQYFAWEIESDRKRIYVGTPMFFGPHADAGPWGHVEMDEIICASDGPPAVYSWSRMKGHFLNRYQGKDYYARYLRLRAVREPCRERRRMLEGVWDEVRD